MSHLFKILVYCSATLIIFPFLLWQFAAGKILGSDRTLEGISQCLSLLPGRFGVVLRAAFFSRVLRRCDWSVFIGFGALITKIETELGEHVYIGPFCQLGWVSIGSDTLLGPGVQIPSGPHTHTFDRIDLAIRKQPSASHCVIIGNDCWLGANSVIMADVGAQSILGAGSVVTKPVPSCSFAAGVPARIIRSRLQRNTISLPKSSESQT